MNKALTITDEHPFGDLAALDVKALRDFIGYIEGVCAEIGDPVEIPIQHYFSKGAYGREMKMPDGALVVGKIHRHQTMNIISEGEVSILSQDGVMRVKAPYTFVSTPGAKRVIYAHSPVTWTCIHGTDETDLARIENEFIAKNYDEIALFCHKTLCVEESK